MDERQKGKEKRGYSPCECFRCVFFFFCVCRIAYDTCILPNPRVPKKKKKVKTFHRWSEIASSLRLVCLFVCIAGNITHMASRIDLWICTNVKTVPLWVWGIRLRIPFARRLVAPSRSLLLTIPQFGGGMMLKYPHERVPESSRRSTACPGGVYVGIDTDSDKLHQGDRRDEGNRKNVLAERPDCGRRDARSEHGFTPRLAIVCKCNGLRDEFQEWRPQTEEFCELCELGGGHELSDGDCLLWSEDHRFNRHEWMPRRTREKAPELCGFLQYERPVERHSRADTPRFVCVLP